MEEGSDGRTSSVIFIVRMWCSDCVAVEAKGAFDFSTNDMVRCMKDLESRIWQDEEEKTKPI